MKTKKVWIPIAILIVAALAYLIIAPINFNIDRDIIAQRANMFTPDEAENIEIRIRGRYSFCLFRGSQFNGQIIIEDYQITQQATVNLLSSFDLFGARVITANQFETFLLGYIRTDFLLRNIDIILFNGIHDNNYRGGYINWENDSNVFISTGNLIDRYNQIMDLLRVRYSSIYSTP